MIIAEGSGPEWGHYLLLDTIRTRSNSGSRFEQNVSPCLVLGRILASASHGEPGTFYWLPGGEGSSVATEDLPD